MNKWGEWMRETVRYNKEKSQVKKQEKWLDDNDEWDDNEHTHRSEPKAQAESNFNSKYKIWNEMKWTSSIDRRARAHTPKTVWSIVSDENEGGRKKERESTQSKRIHCCISQLEQTPNNRSRVWKSAELSCCCCWAKFNSPPKIPTCEWKWSARTLWKNQFLCCCCCCCCKTKKEYVPGAKAALQPFFYFSIFFIQLWKAEAAK